MGSWSCRCVECIGYQHEHEQGEQRVDQAIQPVSGDDLIVLPDGGYEPRHNVHPEWLEENPDHRVIPVNSPEWIAIRGQCQ